MSASRARQGAVATLAVSAVAGLVLSGLPQSSATAPSPNDSDRLSTKGPDHSQRERKGNFDARVLDAKSALAATSEALAENSKAMQAIRGSLGVEAIVDMDPLTRTPRNVGRLDGFLTAASSRPAQAIALGYVRANRAAFGLTSADLSTLRLRQDYVDVIGTHHMSWEQVKDGVPVFGNGLKVHVSARGQVISVQGSPVSGLTRKSVSAVPKTAPSQARAAAVRDVAGALQSATASKSSGSATSWSNGDSARLVWFTTPRGLRLGWHTLTDAGATLAYSHVLDAETGQVLYRRDLVQFDQGEARVFDYYPGAARGGKQHVVDLVKRGWIKPKATWLRGATVSAWADLNDNDRVEPRERTPVPGNRTRAQFTFTPFDSNPRCSRAFKCSWNPRVPFSWRANKKQDVSNAFYLASKYHDYLARRPIGFTARAGNFERSGRDPVLLHALDGVSTNRGLPDGNHINNANMATYPDGTPPTMQMYLWHFPGDSTDPYIPVSGSHDASILYHEYIHGLSNRLVVDATGQSTLNSIQANSMGEAWSDYYSMDYLVAQKLQRDTRRDGQVRDAKYVLADQFTFRNMAMDCDRKSTAEFCTDINGDHGYTYGDFATLPGGPEVHASGEIWTQTLWDLRERLGHRTAAMLITRAMELSAADPSFLDMRNAILQADLVAYGARHSRDIWRVFANRGMGWFAGSVDSSDVRPGQDFHLPPSIQTPRATLAGLVTDPTTGRPVVNALVTITGHESGGLGNYQDRTDNRGVYQINNVYPGTYRKVIAFKAGHEMGVARKVTVKRNASRFTRHDFTIRRDWAARSGGASIVDFNGPDYTPDCGPEMAIDLSQGTGWGSTTGDDVGTPTNTPIPKYIVIQLPRAIDVTAGKGSAVGAAFKIDPTAVCGDAGSASTNRFRIDLSRNGTAWTTVKRGSFGTIDDPNARFRFFRVGSEVDYLGARYVRYWMVRPQVPDFKTNCPNGPFDGCVFMDTTEVEVFGRPAAAP